MKMGLGSGKGRCHKVQGHIKNEFEKKNRWNLESWIQILFWPLLPPKSREKLIYLHVSKGKSMQSNKENEEQNKFPMAWEAHGKTCPQNR